MNLVISSVIQSARYSVPAFPFALRDRLVLARPQRIMAVSWLLSLFFQSSLTVRAERIDMSRPELTGL